jgi:hypothetical protein
MLAVAVVINVDKAQGIVIPTFSIWNDPSGQFCMETNKSTGARAGIQT